MPMIPDELYQRAERMRRNRGRFTARAREQLARARERAGSLPGGIGSISGGTGGIPQSRTEKAALAVIRAEKGLERALKWEKVFRALDLIYPPESDEGLIAADLYDRGMSQEQICRKLGTDRQTVRRRRDRYIYRLILLAAAAGLVTINDIK